MTSITVREYSAFCKGRTNGELVSGYCTLKDSTFEALERFALENNTTGLDGSLDIMSLSARRGVGKIITVKNYVGIIALKDGTTIEILPKIYSPQAKEDGREARLLLVRMLNTVYNISYKNLQTASLDVYKMNILEVFIRMFLDEVMNLTKQGIKSNYETLEDNLSCFKGKILFSKHIRHNFAHKESVYVAYDEFTVNRPENRILKSTLAYLMAHSHSPKNKKDIKYLLGIFDEVELSSNYDADFAKISPDRNTTSYVTALNWARVFLRKKGFTSFSGSTTSIALLFPMEKLFESYIPALMRKAISGKGDTSLSTQDAKYHLFDDPRCFSLRPDIVLTVKDKIFIMDTKWKRLNSDVSSHYGISQSDMYQMYAYYQKYNATQNVQDVTLIYPKSADIPKDITFRDDTTQTKINLRFIDLSSVGETEKSILEILKDCNIS